MWTTCELCGCLVSDWAARTTWHTTHGDSVPTYNPPGV